VTALCIPVWVVGMWTSPCITLLEVIFDCHKSKQLVSLEGVEISTIAKYNPWDRV